MKNKLIEQEQKRLERLGYSSVVTTSAITISEPLTNINLANDAMILTGIRLSSADAVGDTHIVAITSATDAVEASQRDLASMGDAITHVFRSYMVVKTSVIGKEWDAKEPIQPFTLSFIKVTPVKR